MLKGKYNRLSESNKTRKIKARLFGKLRIYINEEYKKISCLIIIKKTKTKIYLKLKFFLKLNTSYYYLFIQHHILDKVLQNRSILGKNNFHMFRNSFFQYHNDHT